MSNNGSISALAFELVTTYDHSAWVMVASNVLITLVVLVVGARLLTRWKAVRTFNFSDVLIVAALVSGSLLGIARTY